MPACETSGDVDAEVDSTFLEVFGDLAINDIDHTKTKAKSPQTNGFCERFHQTVLDQFYKVAFRKKIRAGPGL